MSSVEQALRLKQALRSARYGGGFPESQITHTSNRGHKLEQGAPYVSSRTLKLPLPASDSEDNESDDEFGRPVPAGASDSDDLKVDVAKILQPISDPAEISSHATIRQIFTSPFLTQLPKELLDIIVEDKDSMAQIVMLLECLLGDDDLAAIPQVMANVDEPQPYPTPEPGQPLPPVAEDMGWFFKQPELSIDNNLGLEPEEAQGMRETLQVVQQQLEEYLRCMTQIRTGLTRVQRLRRSVLNWCREMNNEDWVKADLDSQNNYDNASLGDQPAKDFYKTNGADVLPEN